MLRSVMLHEKQNPKSGSSAKETYEPVLSEGYDKYDEVSRLDNEYRRERYADLVRVGIFVSGRSEDKLFDIGDEKAAAVILNMVSRALENDNECKRSNLLGAMANLALILDNEARMNLGPVQVLGIRTRSPESEESIAPRTRERSNDVAEEGERTCALEGEELHALFSCAAVKNFCSAGAKCSVCASPCIGIFTVDGNPLTDRQKLIFLEETNAAKCRMACSTCRTPCYSKRGVPPIEGYVPKCKACGGKDNSGPKRRQFPGEPISPRIAIHWGCPLHDDARTSKTSSYRGGDTKREKVKKFVK
jgi:hypothetical protein